MYAIIDDSGQQFRVQEGDQLDVDLREAEPGATITFDRVVLIGGGDETKIGKPHVDGASVDAEVVGAKKGDKLVVYKYRPRKKYRKKAGHRQKYLAVKITKINAG
jgi:large subunit ribosomal protein L21